jgi:site-specific DNA recombinase
VITSRTLAGKKEKAIRGGFAGGAVPLGYAKDHEGGLSINLQEADLVRRIRAMRDQGQSLRKIADTLYASGADPAEGCMMGPARAYGQLSSFGAKICARFVPRQRDR